MSDEKKSYWMEQYIKNQNKIVLLEQKLEQLINDTAHVGGINCKRIEELEERNVHYHHRMQTLYDNLDIRFNELKEDLGIQKLLIKNLRLDREQLIIPTIKEIAELKDSIRANEKICNLGYQECITHFNTSFKKYDNIEEVLRELITEIFIFTYPTDPEERKKVEIQKYRELLAKLDIDINSPEFKNARGRKSLSPVFLGFETEKKEVGFDGFLGSNEARKEHLKKASGGEVSNLKPDVNCAMKEGCSDIRCGDCGENPNNSKPPEHSLTQEDIDRLVKPFEEPREDDPQYKIDRRCPKQKSINTTGCNCIDYKQQECKTCPYNPEERVRGATHIVKREDLTWLMSCVNFWKGECNSIDEPEEPNLTRIKEEYNV